MLEALAERGVDLPPKRLRQLESLAAAARKAEARRKVRPSKWAAAAEAMWGRGALLHWLTKRAGEWEAMSEVREAPQRAPLR